MAGVEYSPGSDVLARALGMLSPSCSDQGDPGIPQLLFRSYNAQTHWHACTFDSDELTCAYHWFLNRSSGNCLPGACLSRRKSGTWSTCYSSWLVLLPMDPGPHTTTFMPTTSFISVLACLHTYLLVCLFVCLSVLVTVCLFFCLSVCSSGCFCACPVFLRFLSFCLYLCPASPFPFTSQEQTRKSVLKWSYRMIQVAENI